MWPERGVPIEPVAIQTPVERGVADEVGLGATTAGRLALGAALDVGLGPTTTEGWLRWIRKMAPPTRRTPMTAAAATAQRSAVDRR